MPRRRRREGFDYFIDRYENSYYDDYYEYGDFDPNYIPGNRFQKYNKYTGQVQGQPHPVNTSSVYAGMGQQQGTLEFSALPGQGGLNANERPLGDQTLMISNPEFQVAPNPYVQQIIQTQQLQFDQQKTEINNRFNELVSKVDNLTKEFQNTQTLSFSNAAKTQVVKPTNASTRSTTQAISTDPASQKTSTVVKKSTTNNKKKKLSTTVIVWSIFGILITLGLIAVGVLMIMGIIKF